MIGKGLDKRKTQGIGGIKAGGGDQPGFSSVPGRGRGPLWSGPGSPGPAPPPWRSLPISLKAQTPNTPENAPGSLQESPRAGRMHL